MLAQYDRVMRDRMIKYDNLQHRYELIFKADDESDDDDNGDNSEADHVVSEIADTGPPLPGARGCGT